MKKIKKLSSIFLLFTALLLASCHHDENIPTDKLADKQGEGSVGQNVYVAGYENNAQENSVARLWKNGTVQNLGGNLLRSTNTDGTLVFSRANSVFVSGSDVYVSGYEQYQKEVGGGSFETISRARLWKNGEMQNLAQGDTSDVATSAFVSGNDVYVLGVEMRENQKYALKLWKNGVSEIFAEGGSGWEANSIFVSGGNVYVAGREGYHAALWKNGAVEYLDSEINSKSCANSVFISGNDVYVAGCDNDGTVAKLWKNGKAENLNNGTMARSVYVSGSDVYVAGYNNEGSILWKNGIIQDLPDAKDAVQFQSVFVLNNDVYLAGYVKAEGKSGNFTIGYLKATLWKNGKKLNLDIGKNNSWAVSVFVK